MKRKLLLGTTALAGLGALIAATPASAQMEVSVGGYGRWGVVFGNVDDVTNTMPARNFYFRDEFEIHVNAKGKDDATGTEYGVHIELESDVASPNIQYDEAWLWFKGNWGEVRLGDEDGPADTMKITAGSIAAGTGGIDGWFGVVAPVGFHLMNSSDATKIVYYTPNIAGFQAGISFTPDTGQMGALVPSKQSLPGTANWENAVEAGAAYTAEFGGAKLRVGGQFSIMNGEDIPGMTTDVPDFTGYSVGLQVEVSGIKVAGSWSRNSFDGAYPGTLHDCTLTATVAGICDNDRWTLGVGASLGPANVSITGVKQNSDSGSDPRNIVVSGDVTLMPGVALQADVAFWDLDRHKTVDTAWRDDDGVTGVVRIHVGM